MPARWQSAHCSNQCAWSGTSSAGLWWSLVYGSGSAGQLPLLAAHHCEGDGYKRHCVYTVHKCLVKLFLFWLKVKWMLALWCQLCKRIYFTILQCQREEITFYFLEAWSMTVKVPGAWCGFSWWGLRCALPRRSRTLTARLHLQPFGCWWVSGRPLRLSFTCWKGRFSWCGIMTGGQPLLRALHKYIKHLSCVGLCTNKYLVLACWQRHGVCWRLRQSLWMVFPGGCQSWSFLRSHAHLHV